MYNVFDGVHIYIRKALAFLGKLKSSNKDNYSFKAVKCPSSVRELVLFENDIWI